MVRAMWNPKRKERVSHKVKVVSNKNEISHDESEARNKTGAPAVPLNTHDTSIVSDGDKLIVNSKTQVIKDHIT